MQPQSNYQEWQTMNSNNVLGDNVSVGNLYHDLMALISTQSKWSQETFGADVERSALGGMQHLSKEALEVAEAIRDNASREKKLIEFADCFLLLLDGLRREKYTFTELLRAAWLKQQVNMKREWNVHKWRYTYEDVHRINEQDSIRWRVTATKKGKDGEVDPGFIEYGSSQQEAYERVLKYVREYEDSTMYEHVRG